jgi:hypothetical protein
MLRVPLTSACGCAADLVSERTIALACACVGSHAEYLPKLCLFLLHAIAMPVIAQSVGYVDRVAESAQSEPPTSAPGQPNHAGKMSCTSSMSCVPCHVPLLDDVMRRCDMMACAASMSCAASA